jgi:hypothetical protein
MRWRLAQSLHVPFREVNGLAPGRSRASDGTIGNLAHAGRNSDHNPWVLDGAVGVVRARDLTHDPAGGFDAHAFAEAMRLRAHGGHPAFGVGAYIISAARIASAKTDWAWAPYNGVNAHRQHVHFSVGRERASYDSPASWVSAVTITSPPKVEAGMTPAQLVQLETTVKRVKDLHEWMSAMKGAGYPAIDGQPATPAPRLIQEIHYWLNTEGKDLGLGIDSLLASEAVNDPDIIAEALAAAMPADIAGRVVDALAARIGKVAGT